MVEGGRRRPNERKLTKMKQAISLLRENHSQEDVAELLEVSERTVRNYAREFREAGNLCASVGHNWAIQYISSLTAIQPREGSEGTGGAVAGHMVNIAKRRICRDCRTVEEVARVVGDGERIIPIRLRNGHPKQAAGGHP